MKLAIIGGSGKMGRWFAGFLLKDGKDVVITGRNERKLLEAKRQLGVEVATNAGAVKRHGVSPHKLRDAFAVHAGSPLIQYGSSPRR